MFKRYSYQGDVCDPLVIHWPKGIGAGGEVRGQYHHCTDLVDAGDAPTAKETQYFEMLGTRGIWHHG